MNSMNKKRTRKLLLVLAVVVLVFIVSLFLFYGKDNFEEQTVGIILPGSADEFGWNRMHYNGLKKACEHEDAKLLLQENVQEYSGQCEQAVRALAEGGAQMIVLASYNYANEVNEVMKEYPYIQFYCCSKESGADNLTWYFARMYQARYLAGIVAGMQTKTDAVGYVAAMENSEVNRGINAFTLGVQRVNPDAKVYIKWTGSWDDAPKEVHAVQLLVNECNADVITYHQNKDYVIQAADAMGIYSIGYHEAVEGYSDKYLAAAVADWDMVYRKLIEAYRRKVHKLGSYYWLGVENDAVGLVRMSSLVPEECKEEVKVAQEELMNEQAIFSGEIFDNQGKIRCREGERLGDEQLYSQMDWLVKGVEVYEE